MSAGLPGAATALADRGPDWAEFVDHLPRTVVDVLTEWRLTTDGAVGVRTDRSTFRCARPTRDPPP